jgi:type I restriction enzyme, S subunit
MEVRPGYKRTEVGVIPVDWDTRSLGAQFSFKNGLNKGKAFFGHGTPIVNYMDVYDHAGLRVCDLDGRVDVSRQELESFGVRRGDVFFTRTSETVEEVGIASVLLEESPDTVFSGFVLRARPKDDSLVDRFKTYCFSSAVVRKQITSRSTYTTRALTNGRALSSVVLPVPPTKAEQVAIAEALSSADDLIESLQQLLAKRLQLKQGAMQELLAGKTRLPGFTGDWELKRLGEMGATFGGLTGKTKRDFGHGAARYITFMNVLANVVVDCGTFEQVDIGVAESQNRVAKGDLLFNGSSETPEEVGMCAFLAKDVQDVFLNSFCFGFRFWKGVPADGLFMAYFFRSLEGRELLKSLAQGATRYNMSKTALLKVAFRLPLPDEQRAISAVLADIDGDIAAVEAELAKVRQLKLGMIQELLTGSVRLA